MVECIPTGETTTATTCGEATDGTTAEYLMVMFEPTGKAGKAVAIGGINRIEALLATTDRQRRPVGTSEALDRRQGADRLQ
jgi:deoxyribose-phosphate aldolase